MRKALLMLAIFGLAGSLWAADPIIGTWKLDIDKSKQPKSWNDDKSLTEAYREIDSNRIELTRDGIRSDGSAIDGKYIWSQQGGAVQGRYLDFDLVQLLIEPGEWYVLFLRDGEQVFFIHKKISEDGKTMHQTVVEKDEQGNNQTVGHLIFTRQ